jgi:zeaxanthin glucosyltransferase
LSCPAAGSSPISCPAWPNPSASGEGESTHFAIVAPPLSGHYRPLSNLAAELIGRGHRATFIHHPDARPLVEADGAAFEPLGLDLPPLHGWTRPMARISGVVGLGGVMKGMARFTDAFCREAPALRERIGADALLVDQLEPGGALVAEHLGLPFASLAVALPINREPGVPPPFVGWPYDPTPRGLKRNAAGWRVADFLMRPVAQSIARNAYRLGLPARRRLDDCLSPRLQISQLVPALDFPRASLPDAFHYTGPFRDEAPQAFAIPKLGGRPLVYCSLGTLQGSRASLFRKVAEACARLDLALLLTTGGVDPKPWGPLPGGPSVYPWVPQRTVLRHCDLVVCHGGLNTVLDSVAEGLPMVVMPLAFEQSGIAARFERAGVATLLPPRSSSRRIGAAVDAMRKSAGARSAAAAIRSDMAAAGGVRRAADLIEAELA